MISESDYIASLDVMSEMELVESLRKGAVLHKLRVTGKAQSRVEVCRGVGSVQCPPRVRHERGGDSSVPTGGLLDG